VHEIAWPSDTSLLALLREGHVHRPDPDATLEARDELLFVSTTMAEGDLERLLAPMEHTAPAESPPQQD
jgi:trk system potassium uptake protein TrkA